MLVCKKCGGTSFKSRTNYSHGKKSRSRTTMTCKECGSSDVKETRNNFRRRK